MLDFHTSRDLSLDKNSLTKCEILARDVPYSVSNFLYWTQIDTISPIRSYPFYLVTYYIKWVTTSWKDSGLTQYYVHIQYCAYTSDVSYLYGLKKIFFFPLSRFCSYWTEGSRTFPFSAIVCLKDLKHCFLSEKKKENSLDYIFPALASTKEKRIPYHEPLW